MGSVRKPGSQADESRTTRRGPGGRWVWGGQRRLTCSSHIREGLKSCRELGYLGDPLAPCIPGYRGPSQRGDGRAAGQGCLRCRILPALPRVPAGTCQPAAAHGLKLPRLLRRRCRQAGRRGRRAGCSGAPLHCSWMGSRGDFIYIFFQAGKQAPRHARQQRAGWGGGGGGVVVWVRRDGCSQPQDAVPGLQPTDGDVSTSHAAPALAFAAPAGRMRGSSRGVRRGWRRRRRVFAHATRYPRAFPATALPRARGKRGGERFASTRPPTCGETSLRAGDVPCPCPKWWLCPGPWCGPRPSCPPGDGGGGGHTRGIKSCARIRAEPEGWGGWQKRKAEPEGCRGCRNGAGPLARVHGSGVGGDAQRGNNPPPQGTELGEPHPCRAMVLGGGGG